MGVMYRQKCRCGSGVLDSAPWIATLVGHVNVNLLHDTGQLDLLDILVLKLLQLKILVKCWSYCGM